MTDRKTIAIIGVTTLQAIGLKQLIGRCGEVECMILTKMEDFYPFSDRVEGIIVNCDIFVSCLDYFIPRKTKTLVIGANSQLSLESWAETESVWKGYIPANADEREVESRVTGFINSLYKDAESPGELSSREKDVLRLIASGKLNKEIADKLCISVNTVITHRKNISSKLGIKSASGLSLYAMMNGLI